MTADQQPAQPAPEAPPPPTPEAQARPARTRPTGAEILHDIASSSVLVTLGAVLLALVFGAVLIIAADQEATDALGYVFARPADFFAAAWSAVRDAYLALFQGAFFDWRADSFVRKIRPITETMTIATPLIFAGLGIAVGFRAGLFNIGAQGQIILGSTLATLIGFSFSLPAVPHITLAIVGAIVGGALWAGIAGVLKARTGAHEVIVTIMLNNIAGFLVLYLLATSLFASATPQVSRSISASAQLPALLPAPFRLHLGFVLALLAALGVWWLMERSVAGLQFRAVGSNPSAARTAGMSVERVTVVVMLVAGGLSGMAGASLVLGTEHQLTGGIAGSIGFDAITVALLGRSKPLGTVLAGLLFGAFAAGGRLMQTRTGTPIDLVLVLQSLIVLFIAAPPLVRAVFRLPEPRPRRALAAEGAA